MKPVPGGAPQSVWLGRRPRVPARCSAAEGLFGRCASRTRRWLSTCRRFPNQDDALIGGLSEFPPRPSAKELWLRNRRPARSVWESRGFSLAGASTFERRPAPHRVSLRGSPGLDRIRLPRPALGRGGGPSGASSATELGAGSARTFPLRAQPGRSSLRCFVSAFAREDGGGPVELSVRARLPKRPSYRARNGSVSPSGRFPPRNGLCRWPPSVALLGRARGSGGTPADAHAATP
jgi:hypothetical protein